MAEPAKNVPNERCAEDVIAHSKTSRPRPTVERWWRSWRDSAGMSRACVCLYLKRLSDIQVPVLEEILRQSYANVKSQDGEMKRIE